MPAIVIPINKTVDISQGCLDTTLGLTNTQNSLIQGQSYAHQLNVAVNNAGTPVELSGVCTANFLRQADSSTVTVAGTISGNVASVTFPSMVYAYTGMLTITLFVGDTAIIRIETSVRISGTMAIVDPGNILPNVQEMQQIALNAENATINANAAAAEANAAISGVSASATTLSAGSPATASASFVSGSWKIAFGIPQGAKGDPGEGDVSSVDNVSPLNGNVQLNALAMQGSCNNANNALTIGIYICSPSTTNIPVAQYGVIFNITNTFTFDHQHGVIFQFFYPVDGGPTWKRTILNTGQWTAWTLVALEAYPVGSIYMSANSASPASIFGGTWTQLKDRFLLGLGDGGAPAGTTGGAATVTLTEAQLPSHAHASIAAGYQVLAANNQNSDFMVGSGSVIGVSYTGNYTTSNTGANQAHENMPPYYAVYIWRRTA